MVKAGLASLPLKLILPTIRVSITHFHIFVTMWMVCFHIFPYNSIYFPGWWFGTWILCFHILGMSSSQLIFPYRSTDFHHFHSFVHPFPYIHMYVYVYILYMYIYICIYIFYVSDHSFNICFLKWGIPQQKTIGFHIFPQLVLSCSGMPRDGPWP